MYLNCLKVIILCKLLLNLNILGFQNNLKNKKNEQIIYLFFAFFLQNYFNFFIIKIYSVNTIFFIKKMNNYHILSDKYLKFFFNNKFFFKLNRE